MSKTNQTSPQNGIAIIGMTAHVPGARTLEEFWQNICEGKESITLLSDEDLKSSGTPQSLFNLKNYVRATGIVEDDDLFDAAFFEISPNEARLIDPQHRVFLESAWEVLERAGYTPTRFPGSIGVFAGCCLNEYLPYQQLHDSDGGTEPSFMSFFMTLLSTDKDYLATRVSYKLNLRGPSMTVQTACSTSLVAVHLACQSFSLGECDLALAGGVSIRPPQKSGYLYTPDMILSRDGHTYTFDERATGTVFTNGAGIVVLKRLEDAIADNDHIEALIRGSAVNNDGSAGKSAFSAPSLNGQAEVIAEALAIAEVNPESISYVEAHGTATILGDPIEVRALSKVFRAYTEKKQYCAIGSVKSNIGHTVHAAGVVGLIKAALMLKHKKLVPSANFNVANSQIDFQNSPFYVPPRFSEWNTDQLPRRAGVSSFGVGGTNAHIVLEEAPPRSPGPQSTETQILKLSAKSDVALKALASRYAGYLQNSRASLEEICFTANTGRADFNHRLAIIGSNQEDLQNRLSLYARGESVDLITGSVQAGKRCKIGFLFTGQGCQYVNMGKKLYDREPLFRDFINRCDEILADQLPQRLLSVLHSSRTTETNLLDQTLYTQPALFALEYSLARLWESWGIEPDVLIGHSIGEYVAACIAGILPLEKALPLVAQRAKLMNELSEPGEMVAVFAGVERLSEILPQYRDAISVAAINAPNLTILSGFKQAFSDLLGALESLQIPAKRLKVSHGFHSPAMDPILDRFESVASTIEFSAPRKLLISNLNGEPFDQRMQYDAQYLRRHVRETVQFSASIRAMKKEACDFILEIGPHPVLIDIARSEITEGQTRFLPSLNRGMEDPQQILESVARLYAGGASVEWNGIYRDKKINRVELPTYPFDRKRFWIEQKPVRVRKQTIQTDENDLIHPLLGRRLESPLPETQFETIVSIHNLPYLEHHKVHDRIVFPASGYLEMMVAAAKEITGSEKASFHEVVFREPLFLDETPRTLHLVWRPLAAEKASIEIFHLSENGWKLFVSAEYHPNVELKKQSDQSLEALKIRCDQPIDIKDFYAHKWELGMRHGVAFQGVHEIWKGKKDAIAKIRPAKGFDEDLHRYLVHPVLIDSCLQVKEAAFLRSPSNRTLYLPVILEKFTVHKRLPPAVWSWARNDSNPNPSSDIRTISINVMDESGETLAEIERLHLKGTNPAAYASETQEVNNNLYEFAWHPKALSTESRTPLRPHGTKWLIFCDHPNDVRDLVSRLSNAGEVHSVCRSDSNSVRGNQWYVTPDHRGFEWLLNETESAGIQEMIYLWGTTSNSSNGEIAAVDNNLTTLFDLTHAIALKAKPVLFWLVTRGTQRLGNEQSRIHLSQAPLWAFAKVIPREQLEFSCTLIDLDPDNDSFPMLAEEILSGASADQVAFRNQTRYRPQMVRKSIPKNESQRIDFAPSDDYQMVVRQPGILDSISHVRQEHLEPGPHEVVIRVHSTGLNFRDVLIALGRFEGSIGFECSGTIVRKGASVTRFNTGDQVICVASSAFSSSVCVDENLVVLKPEPVDMIQAAGIPIPFLTAHHALKGCARLKKGERILIHAAAGGVGLAAIQIATQIGAEVFATASLPKWDYLKSLGIRHIFNSRTLDFKDQIHHATNREGVDVVLNSLTDDFLSHSLDVLTDNGRFIEIGATNILRPEEFAKRKPHAAYFAFHLRDVANQNLPAFQQMMKEIVSDFEMGKLKAIPTKIFPIGKTVEAFRYMAQAKHTGKIVLTHAKGSRKSWINPDTTYLVTGGLGALGLYTAQWLAQKGAKHIVLMGRRAPSNQTQEVIENIQEKQHVQIRVMKTDVTSCAQLEHAFREIAESMPPLRGIFHAAGALSDAFLTQQTIQKLRTVTDPKIHGAWNLHQLTATMDLDHFVLFSSMSAIWGAAGQTTYAAANAFLDGLAHYRRGLGLPALSVNWGSWGGGGMAVALDERIKADRQARGLLELAPDAALKTLEQVLQSGITQAGILEIDWPRFMQQLFIQDDYYFAAFAKKASKKVIEKKVEGALLAQLALVPKETQLHELISHLNESVAKTLGIPSTEIMCSNSLTSLGIDSLMSIELSNRIQKSLGVHVPMVVFLKGLTIEQLAEELLQRIQTDTVIGTQVQ